MSRRIGTSQSSSSPVRHKIHELPCKVVKRLMNSPSLTFYCIVNIFVLLAKLNTIPTSRASIAPSNTEQLGNPSTPSLYPTSGRRQNQNRPKFKESQTGSALEKNITRTLNHLLHNYEKNLRPNFGVSPTLVQIDLNIRSMGPISEMDMLYSFDCYFRQYWRDERMQFAIHERLNKTLKMNDRMVQLIWRPDTYVYNGQGSYLHNLTTPNMLLRIDNNGNILYSMRLTMKAQCPMDLRKFPMDTQHCPLIIGSLSPPIIPVGYSADDVIYKWRKNPAPSIEMANDLTLSQFHLKGIDESHEVIQIGLMGNFSMLVVHFQLERNMGYFIIQMYVPSSLMVVISWVGFWINREATADRITLGITTVLTMAFLGMDTRHDLPRVSYCTALDIFTNVCFAFTMATVIQFAGVHFFTKSGSGELHLMTLETSSEEEESEEDEKRGRKQNASNQKSRSVGLCNSPQITTETRPLHPLHFENMVADSELRHRIPSENRSYHNVKHNNVQTENHSEWIEVEETQEDEEVAANISNAISEQPPRPIPLHQLRNFTTFSPPSHSRGFLHHFGKCWHDFCLCIRGSRHASATSNRRGSRKRTINANSVSQIDRLSRILFPLMFLLFHLCYWTFYLLV